MSHLQQRINHCSEEVDQLLRTLGNPDSFYLLFSGKLLPLFQDVFSQSSNLQSEQNADSAKVRMIYNTYMHMTKAPSSWS